MYYLGKNMYKYYFFMYKHYFFIRDHFEILPSNSTNKEIFELDDFSSKEIYICGKRVI